MAKLNVQFEGESEEEIISYFGSPQGPEYWPNMGTVDSEDARWSTYYDACPVWVREALPAPID